jgi:hypothetical protein
VHGLARREVFVIVLAQSLPDADRQSPIAHGDLAAVIDEGLVGAGRRQELFAFDLADEDLWVPARAQTKAFNPPVDRPSGAERDSTSTREGSTARAIDTCRSLKSPSPAGCCTARCYFTTSTPFIPSLAWPGTAHRYG